MFYGWKCTPLLRLCISVAIGTSLLLFCGSHAAGDHVFDQQRLPQFPYSQVETCAAPGHGHRRFLVVVSTLDGKISALDLEHNGAVLWTLSSEAPLLSSSISKLEIKSNGVSSRLIPSLDGSLYKYSGDTLEAVPYSAETLLRRSYKLDEQNVIVGGQETITYGVVPQTGEVVYRCSMMGCEYFTESRDVDILVIKKTLQTVRSVEARSGAENWNFSVGQADISFHRNPDCEQTSSTVEDDGSQLTIKVQVVVPEGRIVGVDTSKHNTVLWSHKFSSPVAHAWTVYNDVIKMVDLFDHNHVPALELAQSRIGHSDAGPSHHDQPLLYVGVHKDQIYVQPSVAVAHSLAAITSEQSLPTGSYAIENVPKVHWRPYITSAPSRTPLLIPAEQQTQDTSLVPRAFDGYPFDTGVYLFDCESPVTANPVPIPESENPYQFAASLWNWWKEVLFISLGCSVLVHLFITRLWHRQKYQRLASLPLSSTPEISRGSSGQQSQTVLVGDFNSDFNNTTTQSSNVSRSSSTNVEYQSRYKEDFESIRCLGKGGFGVVFEAKNKLDDCSYAIKRIRLNNSSGAKEKVMREVKALAKLDHVGIVRYYQAWFESPPPLWQEEVDKQLEVSMSGLPRSTKTDDVASSTAASSMKRCVSTTTSVSDPAKKHEGDNESYHVTNNNTMSFTNCDNDDTSDSFIKFEDSGCMVKNTTCNDTFSVNHGKRHQVNVADNGNGNSCSIVNPATNECSRPMWTLDSTKESKTSPLSGRDDEMKSEKRKLYLYIQMQLCRRESLKEWLNLHTFNRNYNDCLWIFRQIVDAVVYVHQCGLMHRDLKPSNIFFSMDGLVKIGDFGLVAALAEHHDNEQYDGTSLHKHTDNVGTQLYMSPELVSGQVYSHKVDIFSLGLIFFELMNSFTTQMERIRVLLNAKKRVFPKKFETDHPVECAFVKKLLSESPDQRPSAEQLQNDPLLLITTDVNKLTRHQSEGSWLLHSSSNVPESQQLLSWLDLSFKRPQRPSKRTFSQSSDPEKSELKQIYTILS